MTRGVFIFWSILVALACTRVFKSLGYHPPDMTSCVKNAVHGVGVVDDEPEFKTSGQVLVVSEEELYDRTENSCGAGILIRLTTKQYPRYKFGDRISFSGNLSVPMNFQSGDSGGRAFDYRGYLAKDDIYYGIKSVKVATESGGDSQSYMMDKVVSWLFALKRNFVSNLDRALGEPHAALASGLVVGEKAALGKDLLADFRTVGLIHIVVLSGYNITIVAAAMRRMLSFLPRAWGIAVGGIGIALFGVMVGGGATVVRSCVMAGIALSANLIRRDYNVVRALVFAALVMLIQSPMILLHDPGFQLSFLATIGLVLLASPIEAQLGFITDKFGLRGIIACTMATQIFVSPYILYMMGQLSVIGVVVNILVLPFIPVTMLFVFLTGAAGMISYPVSQVIGWGAHLLLSYELFMVENFARLPFAAIHLPAFSGWWVVGFYVVFGVGYVFFSRRKLLK